jgi:ubiquinone/menaquinone biosynthesis C-methylase UbiE
MASTRVRRTWERWGAEDPLYGVMSNEGTRGGGWDPEAFLQTGRDHMGELLEELRGRGIDIPPGPVLDFGCGAGRLSLALAEHFDDVHGVDVSPGMLDKARELAADHPRQPTFHHNTTGELSLFPDDTFALAVTFMVLQHMPERDSLGYVREIARTLRPGGIAVVQVPEGHHRPQRLLDSRWLPPRVRNLCVRLKATVLRRPYMEMHMVRRERVVAAFEESGAEVLEALSEESSGDVFRSVRYVARKRA